MAQYPTLLKYTTQCLVYKTNNQPRILDHKTSPEVPTRGKFHLLGLLVSGPCPTLLEHEEFKQLSEDRIPGSLSHNTGIADLAL